jgi:hypothetical protein
MTTLRPSVLVLFMQTGLIGVCLDAFLCFTLLGKCLTRLHFCQSSVA